MILDRFQISATFHWWRCIGTLEAVEALRIALNCRGRCR